MNAVSGSWTDTLSEQDLIRLSVLWGKSNAGGRMNLLIQHLFDAMAVAGIIWDEYLSPASKEHLNAAVGGRGRDFVVWLCGLHDVGKASPAFQSKDAVLAGAVKEAGLRWRPLTLQEASSWHHTLAGGRVVYDVLRAGWSEGGRHHQWIWPIIAGHHGRFPGESKVRIGDWLAAHGSGDSNWASSQELLVQIVTSVAGYESLANVEPHAPPSRSDQLMLSGLMVMADWIASDASRNRFQGIDLLSEAGPLVGVERAVSAWRSLGLRGGWRDLTSKGDLFGTRFGRDPRPSQALMMDAAFQLEAPGLMILEAPMGEGKTEAALAAAEILASRFGMDGIFVGMPTQATSDPMFTRVRAWSRSIDPAVPVVLLHGKRMFNREWQVITTRQVPEEDSSDLDEFGMKLEFGPKFSNIDEDGSPGDSTSKGPAEWYLGKKRGLLAPLVIGTIDQLLYAATRTKHVMLRYFGLAGKVVVLDEIHAADIYMSQFLNEALRWLGQGGVPVVMLSATLPPAQREEMIESYLSGQECRRGDGESASVSGYPQLTTVCVSSGGEKRTCRNSASWRPSMPVSVELLEEQDNDDQTELANRIIKEAANGGCVLVIRNTVLRAQNLFSQLQRTLGDEVELMHARFSAADRADTAEKLLSLLGPPGLGNKRPGRLIVVATQVAEQSFDVDADLLITDLAPIDLVLQRMGRLHRHSRELADRPERLRTPRTVITGLRLKKDSAPWFPRGSEKIYGRFHLIRTAALLIEAASQKGLSIPSDVPSLVAKVYGKEEFVPPDWREDEASSRDEFKRGQDKRAADARRFVLTPAGQKKKPSLAGLHQNESPDLDEDHGQVLVRDGDPSLEILLVRNHSSGLRSLSNRPLGVHGEMLNSRAGHHLDQDPLVDLLGGTVRLPARPELTAAALNLGTLPEWLDHPNPWLKYARVLSLDDAGQAQMGNFLLTYSRRLGLEYRANGGGR